MWLTNEEHKTTETTDNDKWNDKIQAEKTRKLARPLLRTERVRRTQATCVIHVQNAIVAAIVFKHTQ